jgi:predicted enzyme related to lactoylglutathione lyase
MNLDSAVLYTSDISRIKDFYLNGVGLELEYTDGEHYVSFIFPNGARLGINKSVLPREVPGVQTVFIAVENIEEQYEKYKALGYQFYEPFETYDWGKYFAILDPDGNKVGFIRRSV